MTRLLLPLLAVLSASLALPVFAQSAAGTAWSEGQEAERHGDVEGARAHYRTIVAQDPSSRLAGRAEQRLAWLDARDDDPEALSRVLVFRARTRAGAEQVQAFERDVDAMAPGLLRREARLMVAASWDRLSTASPEPALLAEAEDAFDDALAEPGMVGADRDQLVSSYAAFLGRQGRHDEGLLLLDREGHQDGSVRHRLVLEGADAWARPLAWLLVVLLWIGALVALVRAGPSVVLSAARLRDAAPSLAVLAYALVGPYLLGAWYSVEAEHALGLLVPAVGAVLMAAWLLGEALRVRSAGRWQTLAAILAALAPFAAAYLALFDAGEGPLAH